MKTITEALDLILSRAPLMPSGEVSLSEALHRVLRQEVVADMDSPPFDCSAMDGYALCAEDAEAWLDIAAEIQAGQEGNVRIQRGQCARISTGAKIPAGSDSVLMQEMAVLENGKFRSPESSAGENIRKRGENCCKGDVILEPGQALTPTDLAVLASCGITRPLVSVRPRVVHFVTGDELVDPSQSPSGSQIRDCNSMLIAALLEEYGAELAHQSQLPDCFERSAQSLAEQQDFDLLFISGGASVGNYDFARPLLEKAGFEILLRHINMRPGKPLTFGVRGKQLAFGLPGNPVSHAAIFHRLLAPLIEAMLGANRVERLFQGHFENNFSFSPSPREIYWPCRVEWRNSGFRLYPLRFQSSGDVAGVVGMNAFLRIAPGHPGVINAGDDAEFLWLKPIV